MFGEGRVIDRNQPDTFIDSAAKTFPVIRCRVAQMGKNHSYRTFTSFFFVLKTFQNHLKIFFEEKFLNEYLERCILIRMLILITKQMQLEIILKEIECLKAQEINR